MEQSVDLNDIRIFNKVAELSSFTGAGKALGIQKSKISRAISRLEKNFDAPLIYRTTRHLELTTLGQKIFANCREGLDHLLSGIRTSLTQSGPLEGVLRISSLEDMGTKLLVPLIAKFNELYPQIRFELIYSLKHSDLAKDSIDLALRVGSTKQSSYRVRKIGKVGFILVASQKYLERYGHPLTIHDIQNVSLISFSGFEVGKKGLQLYKGNDSIKIDLDPKYVADNTQTILDLALLGKGVALLPDFFCGEEIKRNRLIPVCKEWHTFNRDVFLVTPSKVKSQSLELFTEFVYERIKENLK